MNGIKNGIKRKITSILVIAMCVPALTGCSEILQNIAKGKVEDHLNNFITDFNNDPVDALVNYSAEEVTLDGLYQEQIQLALEGFNDSEITIDKIKLNEKRTKATVELTFEDVRTGEFTDAVATASEFDSQISAFPKRDITFELELTRNKEEWQIKDLNEIKDTLFGAYSDICILDEDGNPLFINDAYVQTIYVGSAWYDPIDGNPMGSNRTDYGNALQNVFYFNQPISMTFVAELHLEGSDDVIDSQEIVLDMGTTAMSDFNCSLDNPDAEFNPGNYVVELYYDGQLIASSDALTLS